MGQSTKRNKRKAVELRKEVLEHVLFLKTLGQDYQESSEKSQSKKRKTPEDHAIETGLCKCTTYCEKCRKRDAIRAWYQRNQEPKKKKSKISLKAYKEQKKEDLNKDSKDFELEEPKKKKISMKAYKERKQGA